MCKKVLCDTCNKPTWAGCGQHIEEALEGVAPADRCHCGETAEPAPVARKGFLARLLGK